MFAIYLLIDFDVIIRLDLVRTLNVDRKENATDLLFVFPE